jgi:hypothetical protein
LISCNSARSDVFREEYRWNRYRLADLERY